MTVKQVTKLHWHCERCGKHEAVETELDPADKRAIPDGWVRFDWVNSRSSERKTADICRECNNAVCDLMHGSPVPRLEPMPQ